MHYFSIHDQSGRHIGFFILLADDESEARTKRAFCRQVKAEWKTVPVAVRSDGNPPILARADRIELFFDEAPWNCVTNI